jgi:hypothetical protein
MKKIIKSGIEIECSLNRELIDIYAHKKPKGWKFHPDGSLRTFGEFNRVTLIEFVSTISYGKNRFRKKLLSFKEWVINNSKETDLKKVISFNQSCGLHLHMGLNYSNDISKLLCVEVIDKFRKDFFKGLDKLNIKQELKDNIKKHYFRKYSVKTTKLNYQPNSSDRYKEINRISERQNKGLEWRSFNILGCDNWNDFIIVIMFAYECFEKLIKKRINGYEIKKNSKFKVKDRDSEEKKQEIISLNTKQEININEPKAQNNKIEVIKLREGYFY